MTVFRSCDGTYNFIRCKMNCSIQLGVVEYNISYNTNIDSCHLIG